MDSDLSVLVDLPGPKIRCATFPEGGVELVQGSHVRMIAGTDGSTDEVIAVDYEELVANMRVSDRVALGDGNVAMMVESLSSDGMEATVVRGGRVQGRPGLQVPSDRLQIATPTPEDLRFVDAFVHEGVDMIAVSFVRAAHDIRSVGVEPAPRGPLLVAKIETAAAASNLDGIVEASGAVMVARGDLGTDFALSELPHLQKHIIRRCIAMGRPVITATQMLESMVYAYTPTCAEASDVANAALRISRGSRGDGGEQVPVGFAGVEQGADPVVPEAGEPERDALDDLDQVVRCLGWPVRHVGPVPGRDLVTPLGDRAAELADLGRARLVLEVGAEAGNEVDSEVGVGVVIDRPDDFFGVPGHADLAARVAGLEQPDELVAAGLVEAFVGSGE